MAILRTGRYRKYVPPEIWYGRIVLTALIALTLWQLLSAPFHLMKMLMWDERAIPLRETFVLEPGLATLPEQTPSGRENARRNLEHFQQRFAAQVPSATPPKTVLINWGSQEVCGKTRLSENKPATAYCARENTLYIPAFQLTIRNFTDEVAAIAFLAEAFTHYQAHELGGNPSPELTACLMGAWAEADLDSDQKREVLGKFTGKSAEAAEDGTWLQNPRGCVANYG